MTVDAPAEQLYDLVTDIARTGEWSPVCTGCWWDEPDVGPVEGAWFTGRNEQPGRTWETRSQVVVADRPREFAFVVGGRYVRWGYRFEPVFADRGDASEHPATVVTETWEFLPDGLAMFAEKYGDAAPAQVAERTAQALAGIPVTLAAIKQIAESATRSPAS